MQLNPKGSPVNAVTTAHPQLNRILTESAPFGPVASDSLFEAEPASAEQLFDRSNLICAQAQHTAPAYIVGRKGAGKTAFLLASTFGCCQEVEVLQTSAVYSEMVTVIRRYAQVRGPLFVDQAADVWLAMFEHVALAHVCGTADRSDPPVQLQVLWDYLNAPNGRIGATIAAEQFLAMLTRRIVDVAGSSGLRETIDGLSHRGVSFPAARAALRAVLSQRSKPLVIVMDNLEDLHSRLYDVTDALAGLLRFVGMVANNPDACPFRLQVCLPSELFDQVSAISANPEKDLRESYLIIHWTAAELLKLAGTRLRLYLQTHHPDRLETLSVHARQLDEPEPDVALLRAALPPHVRNGLGIVEDAVAYLLRHTQLLPRHLIAILNRVFTTPDDRDNRGSVSEHAVIAGTRAAERLIVKGIFAAFQGTFPMANCALRRLSDRLDICFPASRLHEAFNQRGIRKRTGLEFEDFLSMSFAIGAIGIRLDETERYYKAHFQYTFDSPLSAVEDQDWLCFHPLFTRYLHERSLSRLRNAKSLVTYPYGSDPTEQDYRISLGYNGRLRRG
jgi:hypothetical protein